MLNEIIQAIPGDWISSQTFLRLILRVLRATFTIQREIIHYTCKRYHFINKYLQTNHTAILTMVERSSNRINIYAKSHLGLIIDIILRCNFTLRRSGCNTVKQTFITPDIGDRINWCLYLSLGLSLQICQF